MMFSLFLHVFICTKGVSESFWLFCYLNIISGTSTFYRWAETTNCDSTRHIKGMSRFTVDNY